jgi:mono/diheme cytochrome c family protein
MWGLTIWSQISIMGKAEAAGQGGAPAVAAAEQANINSAGGGTGGAPSNSAATSPQAAAGQKVFAQNCSSCHGASGQGMPNVAPPLDGNDFVTGDPKAVIKVVLDGKTGPITVKGQNFNGMMPPWKASLSNKDIADVVTYIRSALGTNHAGAVKEADVAKLKK